MTVHNDAITLPFGDSPCGWGMSAPISLSLGGLLTDHQEHKVVPSTLLSLQRDAPADFIPSQGWMTFDPKASVILTTIFEPPKRISAEDAASIPLQEYAMLWRVSISCLPACSSTYLGSFEMFLSRSSGGRIVWKLLCMRFSCNTKSYIGICPPYLWKCLVRQAYHIQCVRVPTPGFGEFSMCNGTLPHMFLTYL